MLFRPADLERIAAGEVTVAFRRQKRPTVRAGGTLQTRVGLLAIEAVRAVDPARISRADARRAGFADADAVRAALRAGDGEVYRVAFRLAGPDPRIALRSDDALTHDDRAAIAARLERLDRASAHGPWTAATLTAIAESPGLRAADLAASLGREKLPFKADVRKLKALGLTESLEVGYRLSPRGRAYLER
jgi:acyl dehydratase